ncbi:DUF6480 family protein [Streptomyces sp. HNM0574]|uniref:DUF6480 family protein n=1 Tax=Streptomyces sp. HNM0574 TaxID=2714954 RepID=UPI00146ED84B|nr:hypothetical protein [Streptomyces sp. HNM0574]
MAQPPDQSDRSERPEHLVPPEETPPGEGVLSGAGPDERHNPAKGWAAGPLILLAVVTAMFAVLFLAWAFHVW